MKVASFPKFAFFLSVAAIFVLALAGCGGSNNLGLTQGNWAFSATSTKAAPAISNTAFVLGGNLTQSGTNLTGTMYVTQSGCIAPQFVNFTGTVKDKNISLTSQTFGGQVITVAASGTKDSLTGTYTVTGECSDSGTVSANAVPSISGTWNGTISNVTASHGLGAAQATLSVALTQAATPSEDGTFAMSGTLTYTNSVCSVSGTIANGSLAGNYIVFINGATLDTDDGAGEFSYDGITLDSVTAPKNMAGDYSVTGGLCQGQFQSLTLTKQ
jgi:hypothetical protein